MLGAVAESRHDAVKRDLAHCGQLRDARNVIRVDMVRMVWRVAVSNVETAETVRLDTESLAAYVHLSVSFQLRLRLVLGDGEKERG